MGHDFGTRLQLDTKTRICQRLRDGPFDLECFFFLTQNSTFVSLWYTSCIRSTAVQMTEQSPYQLCEFAMTFIAIHSINGPKLCFLTTNGESVAKLKLAILAANSTTNNITCTICAK